MPVLAVAQVRDGRRMRGASGKRCMVCWEMEFVR
jgi:hypothetical protein